jgi:hypothetical protein
LAAATTQIELAAGRWRLTTNSGKVNLSRAVTITPGAASSLLVDLDAARLTMLASPEEGKKLPMNVVFSVSVLDANGTPTPRPLFEAGDRKEASVIVPTGAWRVIAEDEQGRQAATEVTLAPAEERILRLMLK